MAADRDDASKTAVRLAIKVVPGSSRDEIAGWLDDALKVRVRVPPERGKANAAVEQNVAKALGVASGAVKVVAGRTSARKVLEIAGLSASEVARRLSKPGSTSDADQ